MDVLQTAARVSRAAPMPVRGRGFLASKWGRRHRFDAGDWTITMKGGYEMVLPICSSQTWTAAFTGRWSDSAVEMLLPFIEPRSMILDIGASVGLFTVPVAVAARARSATVIAYEPVRRNVEYVCRNLSANGLEDIVVVRHAALGREPADMTINVEGGGAGTAWLEMEPLPERSGATERVELRRLDDEQVPTSVSVVKIDVEGFEFEVFAGAEDLITAHRPVIFAEYSPYWLRRRGVDPEEALEDWATAHRYVVAELPSERRRPWLEATPAVPVAVRSNRVRGRHGRDLLLVPKERPTPWWGSKD